VELGGAAAAAVAMADIFSTLPGTSNKSSRPRVDGCKVGLMSTHSKLEVDKIVGLKISLQAPIIVGLVNRKEKL
jgi:hypothetical protein